DTLSFWRHVEGALAGRDQRKCRGNADVASEAGLVDLGPERVAELAVDARVACGRMEQVGKAVSDRRQRERVEDVAAEDEIRDRREEEDEPRDAGGEVEQ